MSTSAANTARYRLAGVLTVLTGLILPGGVCAAPLPTARGGPGPMSSSLSLDQAVIHGARADFEGALRLAPGAAVIDLPTGREKEIPDRYRAALTSGCDRVGRLPARARLRIISAGPELNSPDTLRIRLLIRRGARLELDLEYTDVVAEGAALKQNISYRPSVEVPLDLPPGSYDLHAGWTVVPSRAAWLKDPRPLVLAPTTYTYAFAVGQDHAQGRVLGPDIAWGEPLDGVRLGLAPRAATLTPGMKALRVQVWYENVSPVAKEASEEQGHNKLRLMFAGIKAGKPFHADYRMERLALSPSKTVPLSPGTRYHEDFLLWPGEEHSGLRGLPGLDSGEQLILRAGLAAEGDTQGAESWNAADTLRSGPITVRRARE